VTGPGTALVVGASGGVGGAVARRLGADGHHVVLHRHRGSVAELSEELRRDGVACTPTSADVTDAQQVAAMFAALPAPLSALVICSGAYPTRPFLETDPGDWERALRLEVVAPYLCIRAAAGAMVAGGSIVSVASLSAQRSAADQAPYASGKAALLSLTRSAALALAPRGIRVNAVSPGLVWRDGLAEQWPAGLASWEERAPLGRTVSADEVAATCAFLAGPGAAGITGQELVVDAGISVVPDY
jgi:NAD(P)-dependent dehydrogenase (short-subunit alcohol dehydrogenase family)